MTTPQLHLCLILAASFALFAWGRWRSDLVAVLALLAGSAREAVMNCALVRLRSR